MTAVISLAACGSGNKNTDAKTELKLVWWQKWFGKTLEQDSRVVEKDNIKLQFTEFGLLSAE